jgi:hypothetical protein
LAAKPPDQGSDTVLAPLAPGTSLRV